MMGTLLCMIFLRIFFFSWKTFHGGMIETQELVETPQAKPLIKGGGGRGGYWERGAREEEKKSL